MSKGSTRRPRHVEETEFSIRDQLWREKDPDVKRALRKKLESLTEKGRDECVQ